MRKCTVTQERIDAYAEVMQCRRMFAAEGMTHGDACSRHSLRGEWTDRGCPVAVAAAELEAERVTAQEDALPTLLREDSPAGDAARAKFGLSIEKRPSAGNWGGITWDQQGRARTQGRYAEERRILSSWESAS